MSYTRDSSNDIIVEDVYISKLSNGSETYTIRDDDAVHSEDVVSTYSPTGTSPVNGVAVKQAVDTAISSVYKAAGSVAFASKPALSSSIEGYVYNITDAFTTTSDFIEGAGKTYPAGTNIVCINISESTYKWDVLAGFVDLSGYQLLLVSGTNIKTINSTSLLGSGNISITGLPSQTSQSGKFLTTNGTTASWDTVYAMVITDYTA